jgi:hypothetical protein
MLQAALVLARLRSHLGRSLVLVVVVAVAAGIALSALAVLRVADDPLGAVAGGHPRRGRRDRRGAGAP